MSHSAELNLGTLHPRQTDAFTSGATEILYGGAAGGGKSHLMRVASILWSAEIPGLQTYLFRRKSKDLEKNHLEGPKGYRALLRPWIDAKLAEIVKGEIRFWNGSKIYLCHCQHEADRYNYQGAEMHVLLVDELTHFTETIYRFLRSRVRMAGIDVPDKYAGQFPRIVCGSNPGNVGHTWVKAAFVDSCIPMLIRDMPDKEGGMKRQYIPARLEDNPSMAEDDPGYEAKLAGLGSPELVKAMRDGNWDVIQGSYFPEWDPERHIVRPFPIPEHWVRIRGFDWGGESPFSVGWWTVSDGEPVTDVDMREVLYPKGSLIRYREWYGASGPNKGIKLPNEEIAAGIKLREETGENITFSVADPAIFATQGGPSIAEVMAKNGVSFRRGDNSRLAGWNQLRSRLIGQDGIPYLYVFDSCVEFIRTFPALQHDERRPEDLDTNGEDHIGDEARYVAMSRPYSRPAPVKTEPLGGKVKITLNELWDAHDSKTRARRRI